MNINKNEGNSFSGKCPLLHGRSHCQILRAVVVAGVVAVAAIKAVATVTRITVANRLLGDVFDQIDNAGSHVPHLLSISSFFERRSNAVFFASSSDTKRTLARSDSLKRSTPDETKWYSGKSIHNQLFVDT